MASGSTINSRMGAMGLGLIDPWQGLAALEATTCARGPPVVAFCLVRWEIMLGPGSRAPAMLKMLVPRSAPTTHETKSCASLSTQSTVGLDEVLEMVRRTAGENVDADMPLVEAGLDSLGAVELRNILSRAGGAEAPLPSTLFFDHPTSRNLAAHLMLGANTCQMSTANAGQRQLVVSMQAVLDVVQRTTGSAVDADVPVVEAGLDSLGAVELLNQLQQVVGETVELPSTLLTDHPTVRLLTIALQEIGVPLERKAGDCVVAAPQPQSIPLSLSSVSSRLEAAFEGSRQELPILRLSKTSSSEPPRVIMHSFLGDESGYERLWKLSLASRAVYAVRHRFLAHGDAHAETTPLPASEMLREYCGALLATLHSEPFDLMGASYGSLVAQHLAHAARIEGARPRRLVLVDPFPFWSRIRETAPNSVLLSSDHGQDARAAAHFILKLRLQSQHGAEQGDAILDDLLEKLAAVPNDAVGLFLAAQSLPEGASREDLLVQALREHRRVLAVSSVGPTIIDLVEGLVPFRSACSDAEPVVLMALASERRAFFEDVYGTAEFEDRVDLYGPALEPIRLEGGHFDVVTRCISNRASEFTSALEDFLTSTWVPETPSTDAWFQQRRRQMQCFGR